MPGKAAGHPLLTACCHLGGGSRAVSAVDGESRSQRATREGRALWRWGQENGCCLKPSDYLHLITGGGQEHRVWYDPTCGRYRKATHAGRYGWTAAMDYRYNKRTQEDEPYIGMGDATPLEYLDRLLLQNEIFSDDIALGGLAIEADGLTVLTSQRFIHGDPPAPAAILSIMAELGYERIPGLPANTEECFSFYDRESRLAAFDAHTGNFITVASGDAVPIDLVMVRAGDAMHEYLCQRIDSARQ